MNYMKMQQARALLKTQKLKVGVVLAGRRVFLPVRRNDFLALTAGVGNEVEIDASLRSECVTLADGHTDSTPGRIPDVLFPGL